MEIEEIIFSLGLVIMTLYIFGLPFYFWFKKRNCNHEFEFNFEDTKATWYQCKKCSKNRKSLK